MFLPRLLAMYTPHEVPGFSPTAMAISLTVDNPLPRARFFSLRARRLFFLISELFHRSLFSSSSDVVAALGRGVFIYLLIISGGL